MSPPFLVWCAIARSYVGMVAVFEIVFLVGEFVVHESCWASSRHLSMGGFPSGAILVEEGNVILL